MSYIWSHPICKFKRWHCKLLYLVPRFGSEYMTVVEWANVR